MKPMYVQKYLLITWMFIVTSCGCGSADEEKVEEQMLQPVTDPLFVLLDPGKTGVTFNNTLQEGVNTNLLMYEYFYNGGGVCAGDVNGDGWIDLYFTGNMVENKLYLNKGNMQFEDVTIKAGVAGRPGPWKTGVTMADVNGDGLLDMYVCYSGKLRAGKRTNQLFINQGINPDSVPVFKELSVEYGLADSSYSTQGFFFDYDRDGDLDMLLLNHNPNSLPVMDQTTTIEHLKQTDPEIGNKLYRNDKNKFVNVTAQSGINSSALNYGLGAAIADLDGDGWQDVYICNDYTVPDYMYINNKNGTFTDVKKARSGIPLILVWVMM